MFVQLLLLALPFFQVSGADTPDQCYGKVQTKMTSDLGTMAGNKTAAGMAVMKAMLMDQKLCDMVQPALDCYGANATQCTAKIAQVNAMMVAMKATYNTTIKDCKFTKCTSDVTTKPGTSGTVGTSLSALLFAIAAAFRF